MARVLVTGGTGFLGSYLVDRLSNRGHVVRALSRKPPQDAHPGIEYVQGNVLTGEGINAATEGVDAVIHAATSQRRMRATEVEGVKTTLNAAKKSDAHFIYVSIVGVDKVAFPYYKAKLEAERVVESAGSNWSIQRATQFHELLEAFFTRLPALPVTKNMRFQLVDAGDVSERLVDLVESGPAGHAGDFGGPEVLPVRQVEAMRRRMTGKKGRMLPVPAVGFFGDFDRGGNLCPDFALGKRTWEDWLKDHATA